MRSMNQYQLETQLDRLLTRLCHCGKIDKRLALPRLVHSSLRSINIVVFSNSFTQATTSKVSILFVPVVSMDRNSFMQICIFIQFCFSVNIAEFSRSLLHTLNFKIVADLPHRGFSQMKVIIDHPEQCVFIPRQQSVILQM